MKKILGFVSLLVVLFTLAACGGNEGKLVVGASNVPHAVILEQAKPK